VFQTVLSLLMAAGAVAFALLAVLAAAGLADPRLAGAAFGVAVLAIGVDELAGVVVAGWVPRGRWQPPQGGRPTARVGRLLSLGAGLALVSTGVVFTGVAWMPRPVLLVAVAVFVVGFALLLVGSYDRRRAEAARGGPDAEPDAAPDRGGIS
jgi:hypothetical protein